VIKLRSYQKKAIEDIREGFKAHKRQIFQLSTGGGKTYCFSYMAFKALTKGKKVAIVTHRIELVTQAYNSISNYHNEVELLTAGAKISNDPSGIICMVESLANRIKKGFNWKPDLLIIDECHISSFNKIIDQWSDCYVLGVSATPIGRTLHKYYENVVSGISIDELITAGFLVREHGFEMQDNFDDLKTARGDYTENSLFSHYDKKNLYDGVVSKWIEKARNLKTLVFCVNIKHAVETAKTFNEAGILSECVTSNTNKEERERILRAHKAGLFPVLVNASILTAGYDDPSIKCIIMNRATTSLTLWLQCVGRGSRPFEGKGELLVLDFGGNYSRFGRWDSQRIWSLEPPKKKSDKLQAAPVKICPKCEAMLHVSARVCEYCEYEYPLTVDEPKEGILVEVAKTVPSELTGQKLSELSLGELYKLQLAKRYKAAFIWRIIRSKGDGAVMDYSIIAGYSLGWVRRQEKDLKNSSYNDCVLH